MEIQKSKNPKLLGTSLKVLDFGVWGFPLFLLDFYEKLCAWSLLYKFLTTFD